jgi:AhpD family alkylhydroperoxidase
MTTRTPETKMTARLSFMTKKNGGIDALIAVESWIAKSFDPKLLTLIKVRVSQMNGCAYCLHLHRHEALKLGETEDRLLLLDAWHESKLYTQRERAALAWAESLTRIATTHAPDEAYDAARAAFSEDELLTLSIGVAMINAWNRLAIGFRQQHPADRGRDPAQVAAQ